MAPADESPPPVHATPSSDRSRSARALAMPGATDRIRPTWRDPSSLLPTVHDHEA